MTKIKFDQADVELQSDVAIVGAGVSGLYCAWRLMQADPDVTVTLVEKLDRTGGRLDSDIVEIKPGEKVREEEGGMRFSHDMEELMTLVKALGLCDQVEVFPMGTPDMPNRFSIRGHTFTLQDAADSDQMIWSELYKLKPEETGLSPTDLVTIAYRNVLLANDKIYKRGQTPDDWTDFRETCTWKGRPMNAWLMWGLLRDMGYSEECIQMLTDTIGFAGPFKSLANAGDAFQILADFPKDPDYFTFERGFSTLTNALEQRLREQFPNRIRIIICAHVYRICGTDSNGGTDAGFELEIRKATFPDNAYTVEKQADMIRLSVDQVVLATASKGCQDLFWRSPALNEAQEAKQLFEDLHASLGMKLLKINLYFTKPWWQNKLTGRAPVRFGPSFSDLPVNAVYPFYALPEEGMEPHCGIPPIRDAAAALTIYCDFENTNYWHGLQNIGPAFDSPLQRQQSAKVPQVMYPASELVVKEAQNQLALLFGTNSVPDPVLTSYRLWDGEEDFGFAYHQWRMNTKDSAIRQRLSKPMTGLYICNEAFSDMHGWVNGSLRSTNLALAKLGEAMFHKSIKPLPVDPCLSADRVQEEQASTPHRVGVWGG